MQAGTGEGQEQLLELGCEHRPVCLSVCLIVSSPRAVHIELQTSSLCLLPFIYNLGWVLVIL